jgi:hypothetical protein
VCELEGAAPSLRVTLYKLGGVVFKHDGTAYKFLVAVPKLRATVRKLCGAVCWNEVAAS